MAPTLFYSCQHLGLIDADKILLFLHSWGDLSPQCLPRRERVEYLILAREPRALQFGFCPTLHQQFVPNKTRCLSLCQQFIYSWCRPARGSEQSLGGCKWIQPVALFLIASFLFTPMSPSSWMLWTALKCLLRMTWLHAQGLFPCYTGGGSAQRDHSFSTMDTFSSLWEPIVKKWIPLLPALPRGWQCLFLWFF